MDSSFMTLIEVAIHINMVKLPQPQSKKRGNVY